jgi:hypothetical protein
MLKYYVPTMKGNELFIYLFIYYYYTISFSKEKN